MVLCLGQPGEIVDPEIAAHLGISLMSLGRVEQAMASFAEALRLDPTDAEVRYNVGVALAMVRMSKKRAVQLMPRVRPRPSRVRLC